MLHLVALLRTNVSEERNSSIIRVTRIGELGTTLTVTNNRRTLQRNHVFIRVTRIGDLTRTLAITSNRPTLRRNNVFLRSVGRLLATDNVVARSPIPLTF
jgi:hypothetical protein